MGLLYSHTPSLVVHFLAIMPVHEETINEKKTLMIEVSWIRPTKLCALFDLILAILCYIIALASDNWVIEKYDNPESDGKRYWVGLWEHCYELVSAKNLLDASCLSGQYRNT